ncbi:RNA polymerase sigma factor [soil metagenome]
MATAMQPHEDFRKGLLDAIPRLRAFALSMTNDRSRADDLVQETLTKAWANHTQFQPGTNQMAWLYTILRNELYSTLRRRRREVEDAEGTYAAKLAVQPNQHGALDMGDLKTALAKLAPDQREALLLVGASGLSYEEAAEICKVRVGTIKSRVNRARVRLTELLNVSPQGEFGPDAPTSAALSVSGGGRASG